MYLDTEEKCVKLFSIALNHCVSLLRYIIMWHCMNVIVNFTQLFFKFDIQLKDCLSWYLTSVYFAKSVLKYIESHGKTMTWWNVMEINEDHTI